MVAEGYSTKILANLRSIAGILIHIISTQLDIRGPTYLYIEVHSERGKNAAVHHI